MIKKFSILIFIVTLISCASAFNDAVGIDGDKNASSSNGRSSFRVKYYDMRFMTTSESSTAIKNGDIVYMDIAIQNATKRALTGASVRLTSKSQYITFIGPCATSEKYYGNIEIGRYKTGYYTTCDYSDPESLQYCTSETYAPFSFSVSEDCPAGLISITITIKDEIGGSWSEGISISVKNKSITGSNNDAGDDNNNNTGDNNDSTGGDNNDDTSGNNDNKSDEEEDKDTVRQPIEYYACHIFDDNNSANNSDGVINPGEAIRLGVCIYNTTNEDIKGVNVTLSTDSQYLIFYSGGDARNYGTIGAKRFDTAYANKTDAAEIVYDRSYTFSFDIDKSCPYNTTIPISFTATTGSGESYKSTFNITVKNRDAALEYYSYRASDKTSTSANNNDGKINPGESIRLSVAIHNKGTAKARGIKVTLSSDNSHITFTDTNPQKYDDLMGGYYEEYRYGGVEDPSSIKYDFDYCFRLVVDSTCPYGNIPIDVLITDDLGNSYTGTFNITVENIDGALEYCRYSIGDNKNNDGVASSGEKIYMDVAIHNKGTSLVKGVNLTLSSTSQFVTLYNGALTISKKYDNIAGGYYCTYYGASDTLSALKYYTNSSAPFVFTISDSTPVDTVLPFSLLITDQLGNRYVESFNVTVQDFNATLVIAGYKCENFTGQDPTKVTKGSTIGLDICVNNKQNGSGKASSIINNLNVTLEKPEHITFASGKTQLTANYGTINVGNYKSYGEYSNNSAGKASLVAVTYLTSSSGAPFQFSIAPDCPAGPITFPVTLSDSYGHMWNGSISITVE